MINKQRIGWPWAHTLAYTHPISSRPAPLAKCESFTVTVGDGIRSWLIQAITHLLSVRLFDINGATVPLQLQDLIETPFLAHRWSVDSGCLHARKYQSVGPLASCTKHQLKKILVRFGSLSDSPTLAALGVNIKIPELENLTEID